MVALLYFTASLVWAVATLKEVEHACTSKYLKLITVELHHANTP